MRDFGLQATGFRQLQRRRGSIYFAVLSFASLVTVIGLAALSTVRVQRQITEGENDLAQAQLSATSGVQLGMLWIAADPNWRTKFSNGNWATDKELLDPARGTFSLEGVDPVDGDLDNSVDDPLLLMGTGVKGQARHKTQVRLVSQHIPLTCLQVAMHAGGNITFNSANVTCDQIISSNGTINASLSSINADVEAAGLYTGATYNPSRTKKAGVPPRTMPAAAAFDYYIANGTSIPFASLTGGSGGSRELRNVLLSSASNPYGATNPQGIYVINCAGSRLNVYSCRIVGTLVVLDPAATSVIQGSVSLEPAVSSLPTLVVRGSMALQYTATTLSEATTSINFNPPGTPDVYGSTNSTKVDTFQSKIRGLVYVSGNLSTSNSVTVDGSLVVGGTATCAGTLNLKYRSTFYDSPPPGLRSSTKMLVASGSWKQIVD